MLEHDVFICVKVQVFSQIVSVIIYTWRIVGRVDVVSDITKQADIFDDTCENSGRPKTE